MGATVSRLLGGSFSCGKSWSGTTSSVSTGELASVPKITGSVDRAASMPSVAVTIAPAVTSPVSSSFSAFTMTLPEYSARASSHSAVTWASAVQRRHGRTVTPTAFARSSTSDHSARALSPALIAIQANPPAFMLATSSTPPRGSLR